MCISDARRGISLGMEGTQTVLDRDLMLEPSLQGEGDVQGTSSKMKMPSWMNVRKAGVLFDK